VLIKLGITVCSVVQKDQLRQHECYLSQIDSDLAEHTRLPPERGAKALVIQNYVEKETYLRFEVGHDWLLFPLNSLTESVHFVSQLVSVINSTVWHSSVIIRALDSQSPLV